MKLTDAGGRAGAILVLACLAAPSNCLANDEGYFGIGFAHFDQGDRFVINGEPINIDTVDLVFRFGADISAYSAVELRAGSTITPDETTVGGTQELELKNDYFAGAYFRVHYPVSWLTAYGQAGVVRMKESVKFNGLSESDKFTDTSSWAAGVDIDVNRHWLINVEYFYLANDNSADRGGPGASLVYRF